MELHVSPDLMLYRVPLQVEVGVACAALEVLKMLVSGTSLTQGVASYEDAAGEDVVGSKVGVVDNGYPVKWQDEV